MISVRSITGGLLGLWTLLSVTVHAQEGPPPADPGTVRMVEVDGHAVRVQVLGLERRGAGEPIVVFEAGAGNPLEVWTGVLPHVAESAAAVAYDRAGLGQSEWDGEPPTPQHVAQRLRRVLDQVGAEPPYVLVGFSWGGPLVRHFAGVHPDEVVGIVYVDPGPIVTQAPAENLAPFEAIGAGREGYEALWSQVGTAYEQAPPAMRAEFEVFRGMMEREVAERELLPVPEVPVVVILAGKYTPPPPFLQLPCSLRGRPPSQDQNAGRVGAGVAAGDARRVERERPRHAGRGARPRRVGGPARALRRARGAVGPGMASRSTKKSRRGSQ